MPAAVVNHARHTLEALEQQASASRAQIDLFAPPPAALAAGPGPVESALARIDPDALTPREALDALYRLKHIARREQATGATASEESPSTTPL